MKNEGDIFDLVVLTRETSFELHRYLRHGHLEKVYENGLANRLRKKGMGVEQQHPLKVYDEDGTVLGEYFAGIAVAAVVVAGIFALVIRRQEKEAGRKG